MSFSVSSHEELQAIMNVTVESLAGFCGLTGGEDQQADYRSLMQQLGILQTRPMALQKKIHNEFAAKYLPALMSVYRESSGPLNAAMTMLNVISYTAYFVRFQRSSAGSDLAAIQAHRTAIDPASTLLDIDTIGEITQFLGTLLLLQGTSGITEDDKKALLSKMNKWKNIYRGTGRVAEKASERCNALLARKSGLPAGYKDVKDHIEQVVEQCGAEGCSRRQQTSGSELMQCARCKSALYCGTAHQKQAWPSHKSTCFAPTF
ncbi:hypothetical protein PILCRDRAFT_820376 [Piloderma croceum F 1598]|uniref:MYND-type domain-containing protein n=1 Tax=Piloderma croceum (strain F 1598) TaxID=765440 RepID=A0A0C3B891_PILCF|nr:hypothetical protein PILCRDRAFT_820376 [Piloderma croceum F 1598]